jgi:hypothetical protein
VCVCLVVCLSVCLSGCVCVGVCVYSGPRLRPLHTHSGCLHTCKLPPPLHVRMPLFTYAYAHLCVRVVASQMATVLVKKMRPTHLGWENTQEAAAFARKLHDACELKLKLMLMLKVNSNLILGRWSFEMASS